MSCENMHERIAAILDNESLEVEIDEARAHMKTCGPCSAHLESAERQRRVMRSMNRLAVPADLTARLRVIASHEHSRQMRRRNVAAFLKDRWSSIKLVFDNLMRPVALPAAGGSLSSLVLFAALVPVLSFPHNFPDSDLSTLPDGMMVIEGPAGPYMASSVIGTPRIQQLSTDNPADANVVELTIDQRGRVTDYSVARGRLTPDLESIIMFSKFTPATVLGSPATGKVKAVQDILQRPSRRIRS
jgi:hypothetical protein